MKSFSYKSIIHITVILPVLGISVRRNTACTQIVLGSFVDELMLASKSYTNHCLSMCSINADLNNSNNNNNDNNNNDDDNNNNNNNNNKQLL